MRFERKAVVQWKSGVGVEGSVYLDEDEESVGNRGR